MQGKTTGIEDMEGGQSCCSSMCGITVGKEYCCTRLPKKDGRCKVLPVLLYDNIIMPFWVWKVIVCQLAAHEPAAIHHAEVRTVKRLGHNVTSGFRRRTQGVGSATLIDHNLRLAQNRGTFRTQEDLLRIATQLATAQRQIMFTTVTMDRSQHQLLFFRQWAGNLRSRLANALVIGTNEYTCRVLRNASIPCFVDKLAPSLSGKQNFFGSQVLLKWWYANALLLHSFHIIFSDPDIAWVRDPFAAWDESYDLQGLSDIRSVNLTVQRHHEITCVRPWMDQMYEHSKRSIYPCMSTGLWYMRDTVPSRAFSDGLYGYLRARSNEWEQKAFQVVSR